MTTIISTKVKPVFASLELIGASPTSIDCNGGARNRAALCERIIATSKERRFPLRACG